VAFLGYFAQAPLRGKGGCLFEPKGIFPYRRALAQPDEATIQYYRISAENVSYDNPELDPLGLVYLRRFAICFMDVFFAVNHRGPTLAQLFSQKLAMIAWA
jgi:hypothetical protein